MSEIMSIIPLDFILNTLNDIFMYHKNLISGAEDELHRLQNDLRMLSANLKDASVKRNKTETFKEWERQVREAIYDVEDTIDTCILQLAAEADMNPVYREASRFGRTRINLAKQVQSLLQNKVQPLLEFNFDRFSNENVPDNSTSTRVIRQQKREHNVVGFDGEAKTLITHLKQKSDSLAVISIVGMPGLGKTTMAWKIFKDPDIEHEFHTRIWVNISEDFAMRNVLLTIQKKFRDQLQDMTDDQLTEDVKYNLKSSKFLLVLDDVWTVEAWNRIKTLLELNNENGRVLITSRNNYMATTNHTIQKLKFLTADESWELLQYEVYGKQQEVDPELIQVGKVIAKNCAGLPLSIIVIGGILANKRSKAKDSLASIRKEWQDVSESLSSYLSNEGSKRLENIISLSFAKMPYELKSCFLYLGMFPEDVEIPAKRLTLLWIAERFIPDNSGRKMEDIARDNLNDLINRNLVMIDTAKHNGDAKICRVHDTIREFCKREAASDKHNLYQEIVYREDSGPSLESTWKSCRRLCIHSQVKKFLSKKPKVTKARSFLCFPMRPVSLERGDISCYTETFSILRVLDAENIKFPKCPPKLNQLFFLRYLTLAIDNNNLQSLPKTIYGLKNLQTLILVLTSRTIKITEDVWKMRQMRHLKTKASIIVKTKGEGDTCENLQTLSRLSPESCTDIVFNKVKNLTTLGIEGDLFELEGFNCLEKLDHLNKLKLVHDLYVTQQSEQQRWPRLPNRNKFPPNLRILVLECTCLSWDQMCILGKLSYLVMLKLKNNAFIGESWNVTEISFPRLELLHIERADLMSWTAVVDAFPELTNLYLKTCEKLKEVPPTVVKKLNKVYVERVTPELISFVKKEVELDPEHHRVKRIKIEIAPTDRD